MSPERIALYADATNDANPAYSGDAGIAPHMLHTRMFKERISKSPPTPSGP